jgi:hypothetical protein
MPNRTARIEVYMKNGTVNLSTKGAIVRMKDHMLVQDNVVTRLTGGTVIELPVDGYYIYQFNIAGEGKFTLAARIDAVMSELEHTSFDSGLAKQGAHSERSFAFKVPNGTCP